MIVHRLDGKYDIAVNESGVAVVRRRTTEVAIPNDEPVILFRAKDALAVPMLQAYLSDSIRHSSTKHVDLVKETLQAFQAFQSEHPERMKFPD